MLRRLIVLTALAAGMSIGASVTLATPALAKGPSQVRITGPGLAHAIVVSGGGEPGQQGALASLAEETNLFTVMFGPGGSVPAPRRLRTAPSRASLGPRFTVVYTVPGVEPKPGQRFGQVRQDIYPYAAGGPVTYTPPGQRGFGQNLRVAGWLRGRAQLVQTLTQLGVLPGPGTRAAPLPRRSHAANGAAARRAHSGTAWLVALAAVIAAGAFAGAMFWLRHRRPGSIAD
jgi:hypothetical protein